VHEAESDPAADPQRGGEFQQTVTDNREHFKKDHLPLVDIAVSADHGRMLTMLADALTAEAVAP
jgi:hypothetical protein